MRHAKCVYSLPFLLFFLYFMINSLHATGLMLNLHVPFTGSGGGGGGGGASVPVTTPT